MILHVIAFVAGAAVLQVQAELPPLAGAFYPLLPAIAAYALGRVFGDRMRHIRTVLFAAAAFGAGCFWAAALAQHRMADALPHALEGRDLRLVGVVAGLPQPFERGVRFEFDVESVTPADARVPARISLAWYGTWRRDARPATLPGIHAGERWSFGVRLKRPHGLANPHGFDYEAWLLERGIRATGYVRLNDAPRRLDSMVHRPGYWIERVREAVCSGIRTALADVPYAGGIVARVFAAELATPQA